MCVAKRAAFVCGGIRLYIRSLLFLLFSLFFRPCEGHGTSPSFYRMPKYLVTGKDIEDDIVEESKHDSNSDIVASSGNETVPDLRKGRDVISAPVQMISIQHSVLLVRDMYENSLQNCLHKVWRIS